MIKFQDWLEERRLNEGLRAVRFKQSGGKPHVANFGNIQLRLMKSQETGEFVVAWYENGKYNDDKSYHTNDQKDAMGTMDLMAREIIQQQQQKPVQKPMQDDPSLHHLTYDELSPRP